MGIDRFELADQVDSLNRIRQVLLAAERQLAALAGWLDEVEFILRHSERSGGIED